MDSQSRKHVPVDEVLLHDMVKHSAAILSKYMSFYGNSSLIVFFYIIP